MPLFARALLSHWCSYRCNVSDVVCISWLVVTVKTSKSYGCWFAMSITSRSDWNYFLLQSASDYRGSPLVVLIVMWKFILFRFQLEKGHAFACFGSRGYSPARYIWGPLWLCCLWCDITGVTCCEVKHIRENLREFHFESKNFVM